MVRDRDAPSIPLPTALTTYVPGAAFVHHRPFASVTPRCTAAAACGSKDTATASTGRPCGSRTETQVFRVRLDTSVAPVWPNADPAHENRTRTAARAGEKVLVKVDPPVYPWLTIPDKMGVVASPPGCRSPGPCGTSPKVSRRGLLRFLSYISAISASLLQRLLPFLLLRAALGA